MDLRQLDKKYFGRQGDPEDVIVGSSADSKLLELSRLPRALWIRRVLVRAQDGQLEAPLQRT